MTLCSCWVLWCCREVQERISGRVWVPLLEQRTSPNQHTRHARTRCRYSIYYCHWQTNHSPLDQLSAGLWTNTDYKCEHLSAWAPPFRYFCACKSLSSVSFLFLCSFFFPSCPISMPLCRETALSYNAIYSGTLLQYLNQRRQGSADLRWKCIYCAFSVQNISAKWWQQLWNHFITGTGSIRYYLFIIRHYGSIAKYKHTEHIKNHSRLKKVQICTQWCHKRVCHCIFYTVSGWSRPNTILTAQKHVISRYTSKCWV